MRAEVGEFYHFDPSRLEGRALSGFHVHIDAMYSVRVLREEWNSLTVEGVQFHGERAYGPDRAFALAQRKMMQLLARKEPD